MDREVKASSIRRNQFICAVALSLAVKKIYADNLGRVSGTTEEVAQLEKILSGNADDFNFEADSLQKRLLDFFETELGYATARADLEEADSSRRRLLAKIMREDTLGLHGDNKEMKKFVQGFSPHELSLLQEVVVAESPSEELKRSKIQCLIVAKIRAGRGEDLFHFLSSRLKQRRRREKSGKDRDEPYNANLAVVGASWTHPDLPLWLMPSAGGAKVLESFTGEKMNNEAFNEIARMNKLKRLPTKVWNSFIKVSRTDAKCLELRAELEKTMGIKIASVQRGSQKKKKHVI